VPRVVDRAARRSSNSLVGRQTQVLIPDARRDNCRREALEIQLGEAQNLASEAQSIAEEERQGRRSAVEEAVREGGKVVELEGKVALLEFRNQSLDAELGSSREQVMRLEGESRELRMSVSSLEMRVQQVMRDRMASVSALEAKMQEERRSYDVRRIELEKVLEKTDIITLEDPSYSRARKALVGSQP
jgi:predicted RNase H-like nuclease (RuvC/YqgF family)